jgi:hypothetical protein
MHPTKRTCLALLLTALVGAVGLSGCRQPSDPGGPSNRTPASRVADPPQVPPRPPQPIAGTLSCSGRGCHADLDRSAKGSRWPSSCSCSLWLDHDPHTRARAVLGEPAGKAIAAALGLHRRGPDGREKPDATVEPRCLACHVTPQTASLPLDGAGGQPEEWNFGVGCEACHGSARQWLVPHRSETWTDPRGKKWQELSPAEKQTYGMNDLSSLAGRARVCAGCHVGAAADEKNGLPLRDMNHDHIAAGHPRLTFEFGAFLAHEPRHWNEKKAGPDFEARAWLVGQVVAAEAALNLLADRAKNSQAKDRPWPEYAEYDCYACHHRLEPDSWRRERGYPKGHPGRLLPSRWSPGLLDAVGQFVGAKGGRFPPGLEAALRRPFPRPAEVEKQARDASDSLAGLADALERMSLPPDRVAELRKTLARRGAAAFDAKRPAREISWDEAEQLALGILALLEAEGNADLKPRARALHDQLRFPADHDSNPGFHRLTRNAGGEIEAPQDDALRKLFEELQR